MLSHRGERSAEPHFLIKSLDFNMGQQNDNKCFSNLCKAAVFLLRLLRCLFSFNLSGLWPVLTGAVSKMAWYVLLCCTGSCCVGVSTLMLCLQYHFCSQECSLQCAA